MGCVFAGLDATADCRHACVRLARFAGAAGAVRGDGSTWYTQERAYAEAMAAMAESHLNVSGAWGEACARVLRPCLLPMRLTRHALCICRHGHHALRSLRRLPTHTGSRRVRACSRGVHEPSAVVRRGVGDACGVRPSRCTSPVRMLALRAWSEV